MAHAWTTRGTPRKRRLSNRDVALQRSFPVAAITNKMAWIRVVALRRYHRPPGPRMRPRLARDAEIPDLPSLGSDPGELTVQTQMVLQALRNLDEEARAVMAFDLDDFPTADIATALEITEQRVRTSRRKPALH